MKYGKTFLILLACVVGFMLTPPTIGHSAMPEAPRLAPPIRLMSPEKDTRLRKYLPKVNDDRVQRILDDPALILYTRDEIPAAYQDWSSGLQGIHSPSYNISADRQEPFGNGNVEFPWGAPAGTHRTRNVVTFRFLWLPKDEEGKPRPIVWYRQFLRGSSTKGYGWTFPAGAIVGEVLGMRAPDGKQHTFELRLRERDYGEWLVDVFRPFPTSELLSARVKELRPDWRENARLAKLIDHLEQPRKLKRRTLSDKNHSRSSFDQSMGVDSLPAVGDDKLVARLLAETVFESSLGATWHNGTNVTHTVAPTTKAVFHIVPARYDAGFIEVDRISCMRCHETANRHVDDFDASRDWYGRVRGSDGIFSIHPFDPSCVSHNGFGQPVRLNDSLMSAGVFAKFDRKIHSNEIYQRLP